MEDYLKCRDCSYLPEIDGGDPIPLTCYECGGDNWETNDSEIAQYLQIKVIKA